MSTTFTPAEYLAKYAVDLYALTEPVYSFWLEDAANGMNPDQTRTGWGSPDRYNKAKALIAAHNWTRSGSAATINLGDGALVAQSPGAIASQSTLRESVAYGNPGVNNVNLSAVEAEWATTVYGRMLLQLTRTRPAFGSYAVSAGW